MTEAETAVMQDAFELLRHQLDDENEHLDDENEHLLDDELHNLK